MAKELTVKMISENELDNKLNDVFVKSVNTVNAGLVAKGGVIDNLTQGQTNIISTMNVIKDTADNSKKIADTAYQNSVGAIDSLKNKADISHKHNLADINDLDISKYSTKDEVKTSVDDAIKKLVGSAPDTLNTLQKIAQELQDPSNNTASTVLDQIANKADASALTDEVIRAKAAEKANADEIAKKANSTDVYTKIEIDNKGYLTEHQLLNEYAKKTDLSTDFYSKAAIDSSYNSLKKEIDSKQDSVDLSVYALKTEIPTDFYSKKYIDTSYNSLNSKIDSKQDSVNLSVYALKTEIPTDFYSKKYIDTSYNNLDSKIDSKQDKGDYALKTDIPNTSNFVTNTELDNKHYLTENQSLAEYAKKTDLPTDFYSKAAIDSSYNSLKKETEDEITEIKKWMRTIVESLAGNKAFTAKLYDASNNNKITSEFNTFAPVEKQKTETNTETKNSSSN